MKRLFERDEADLDVWQGRKILSRSASSECCNMHGPEHLVEQETTLRLASRLMEENT